jgi:hypothetical protein
MQKIKLRQTVSPDIQFSIVEDASEVDGVHILAKIKGQFFVPDGTSRNGRYYPRALWEKQVDDPKIKTRLAKRTMFGTIGHNGDLDDAGIREGNASHFMTKIFIDEDGRGMGEALVMGTPTGKILNTLLRSGSALDVSSRADGTYKGKKDGLPIVDEATYSLSGWDFVIDAGFLEANPTIAESLDKAHDNENEEINVNQNEENKMDKELVKHITDENASLKVDLGKAADKNTELSEQFKNVSEENSHLKGEMGKLEEANKLIAQYAEIGTVEEVQEKLKASDETSKIVEAFKELGDTPEAVKEALTKSNDFMKKIEEDFGTHEQIKTALETSIEFKESVDELGSVEAIKESLETLKTIVETKEADDKVKLVKELAEELKIKEEKVTELLEKNSADDIRAMYAGILESTSDESLKYRKKKFDEAKKKKPKSEEGDDDEEEDDEESDGDDELKESKILGRNRISRLNEELQK